MIQIIQYRDKCIGCHACVDVAYHRWRMSRTDGKSTLVGATHKKNIYRVNVSDDELEESKKAEEVCPVKIIKVSVVK